MILELAQNRSFSELMKKRKRLTEPEVQLYMQQIIEALVYLHGIGVIHRDLKLGNLLLDKVSTDTFVFDTHRFCLVEYIKFL